MENDGICNVHCVTSQSQFNYFATESIRFLHPIQMNTGNLFSNYVFVKEVLMLYDVLRIFALYMHLVFFALAVSSVIMAEYHFWKGLLTTESMHSTANHMKIWLFGLWCSGLTIIALDTGFDLDVMLSKPKLILKLICVSVLTINGCLLHRYSFNLLLSDKKATPRCAKIISVTGGLSTSHWILAVFIGITAELNKIPLLLLLLVYCCFLAAAVIVSRAVAPIVQQHLNLQRAQNKLVAIGIKPSVLSVRASAQSKIRIYTQLRSTIS